MCDNNNLGYMLNRNKPCTKCGQEVDETSGYRYCHRCGTIFYACCESHSVCPQCNSMIKVLPGLVY